MAHPWLALVAAFFIASVTAQSPALVPSAASVQLGVGAGLQWDDGELRGCGTDYKVDFRAGTFVYTPMLGKAAPRDMPLAMTVTHAGREAMLPVGAAEMVQGDLRVDFVRPQLREVLEVRPEGLKQSFVFATLPPGDGDLVVRMRLTTELQPEVRASSGALRFLFPASGGVEVGQVVGIDANGKRATGSLRSDGSTLEVVLPSTFVSSAALPLVVDPLLSSVIVTSASLPDADPDVCALPAPQDLYLVVWRRSASATNEDIRGQRVSFTGVVQPGLMMLDATAVSATSPVVTGCPQLSQWFVAWNHGGDILGRFISSTGLVVTSHTISNSPNVEASPQVAGGNLNGDPCVLCVWQDQTANALVGRRINFAPFVPGPVNTLVSGALLLGVGQPSLSRDNLHDRILLTWTATQTLLGTSTVRGAVLGTNATLLTSSFAIAGATNLQATSSGCAGDGVGWVVAYNTSSTLLGLGAACATVRVDGNSVAVGTPRSLIGQHGVVRKIAVADFGDSACLAMSSANGANNDIAALSIDPFTCADCEGSLSVDLGGNDVDVAVCSRNGYDPFAADGAMVYVLIVGGLGDVTMRLLRAIDGQVAELDVGCSGGEARSPCARSGNTNFGVQLRGALPNALALVVHSLATMNFQCGPCVVVPDTATGVITFLGASTPLGDVRAPLPLPPGIVGMQVFSQFVFFGGSCLSSFQLTEALQVTIE